MRLLLIDDDPRYRALLRHHVTCDWPDADLVAYNPVVRGRLAPEFLAQGFDAVILDQDWKDGSGLDWLRDLAARPGFAPILFLADRADDPLADEARAAGAAHVIAKTKIRHDKLRDAITDAAAKQKRALDRWQKSDTAREAIRFGDAHIPGYRRIRSVGVGSVSQLYLAESITAGTLVVLKVTPVKRREDGVDQAYERFVQEFEIVKRVRHQSIVRLYDLGVAPGHAYLVMEYFANGDLRQRMRDPISPVEALGYALDIALALEAIHEAGVLHRDLKPGNVMLRDDGSLALIDFGLAKHETIEHEITGSNLILGTPHYMSPEQGHGEDIDGRSDLYSLGVILYEMLTRSKPFDADNPMAIIYKHKKVDAPPLPEPLAWIQPVLNKLMAKSPQDRYGTARDAVMGVRKLLGQARDEDVAA